MTEGLILPPEQGAPEGSIEGTVCPVRSATALASLGGAPSKVSMDVPCTRRCMWFMVDQNEKPQCAHAVLALAMADRA